MSRWDLHFRGVMMALNCVLLPGASRCQNCGWKYKYPNRRWPNRNCDNPPDLRPAADKLGITTNNIKHYARALARWTAAGMPTREQAEVERLEAVCRACEHYRKGRCTKCGCCVSKSRAAWRNKIKMATENCPVEKW